jgi:large subunit ribosomal protein L19
VRRAKLYYLRGRVGKRARVRERRYVGPEELVEGGLLHDPAAAAAAEADAEVPGDAIDEQALAEAEGRETATDATDEQPPTDAEATDAEGDEQPSAEAEATDAKAGDEPSGEAVPAVAEEASATEAPDDKS